MYREQGEPSHCIVEILYAKAALYSGGCLTMGKNLTNNQILLNEIIHQEHQENPQFVREDDFFEFFAAQQVLKDYDLSFEEIEQGLTGTSLDGGCDGIYVFVNGDVINEEDDVAEKYKKDVKFVLCIIQAKNATSFNEDPLMKWKTVCKNLLDLSNSSESFKARYDVKVLQAFDLFKDAYIKLIRKKPKLSIEFKYVSKGNEVHQNVQYQADELCQEIKSLFPSPTVTVSTSFVGADMLMDLVGTQVNNEFFLKLTEAPITISSQQVYITLVNLAEYFYFITNEKQEMIKHIFESNVRDYQGHTTVNKEIQESLESNNVEDFWWLNNGVTIVASKANLTTGKEICITDPEVVNGLQTSTEIFNYFSEHKNKLSDERRNILVRIIVPDSDESRDRIILATNSQTSIPKSSLRATDSIHRQIEMFFKPRNLYYDRRKNYYKNLGKKATQIVSVSFLAQCLMSLLLQMPNYARARPSTLLTDDRAYKELYVDNQNLNTFYAAAFIGKQVENVLKKSSQYTTAQKADILFYVIYMTACKKANQIKITSNLLATIDLQQFTESFILECAQEIFDLYQKIGGTDKVAKGSELIKEVQKSIQLNIQPASI